MKTGEQQGLQEQQTKVIKQNSKQTQLLTEKNREMGTKDIAKLDEIRQRAIDFYLTAKKRGEHEDIEAGLTLHYNNGQIQEHALAGDTVTGILLHVREHTTRGIVVIRLNNTASKYTELKQFNLQ